MKLIIVPIVAIIAILIIELYALSQGINGAVLSMACVLIGGLGGYEAKIIRDKLSKPK